MMVPGQRPILGRIDVVLDPVAEHGQVRPPAASAPRCAAASMPRANPLTIVTPLDASSAASDSATSTPYAVAARAPTMAIAQRVARHERAAHGSTVAATG